MSTPLPRLSRYEVLGRLATGGMAEVFLARSLGVAGFEKLVVLKTILPQLASEPTFVNMFINEGRLAARLNHPNCVQIFDLGQEGPVLYLAMEYIEGFSLSRILKRAKDKSLPLTETLVARIAMDAASGLDYAHRLADRDGTPLKLVHRDISPDNILVGFSGQTRVVDFGIAKAATPALLASATVAGTVKGKHGFIAPEYLLGRNIDGRADLFALGVVMYRALTRKRPFGGATDAAISMSVLQDTPPAPHTFNPLVSQALSSVVMLALEKEPANRFESARTMRQAIEAAVGRPADTDELADYLQKLWPPGDAERTALDQLAQGNAEERSGPVLQSVVSGTWAGQPRGTPGSAGNVVVHATPPTAEELSQQLLRGSSGPPAAAGGAPGDFVERLAPIPERTQAVPSPAPAQAPVAVFETPEFDPPSRGPSVVVVVIAMLVLGLGGSAGWAWWNAQQTGAQVVPTPIVVVPQPAAAPEPVAPIPAANAGEATVVLEPPVPAHVFEGNKDLGATPLTLTRPPGALSLRLVNKSLGLDQQLKLTLEGGQTTKVDTVGRGTLVVKVEPFAEVKVDGKSLGQSPVTAKGLFEGTHVVECSNAALGSRRREVKVKAGETKSVTLNLLEEAE